MKAHFLLAAILFSLLPSAYALPPSLGDMAKIANKTNISDLAEQMLEAQKSGMQQLQNMSGLGMDISKEANLPLPASPPQPPKIHIPESQLKIGIVAAAFLVFVFAAGKIADFLQSTGKRISKREALYAPFAYFLLSMVGIAFYFLSNAWKPPQDTLITNAFYLLLVPASIMVGLGALALHAFFHDRLRPAQSLDLSIRIVFAPAFDGLRGYWTALGAAAILAGISAFSFYSSGGRLSLATFDFLLLSIVVSIFYLYKAFASSSNESKASNAVTILTILAPSLMQNFFRESVCSLLSKIPLEFFRTCPLLQAGNEVTLAFSVGATMLLVMPVVPFIYALMVNLLRALTLLDVLLRGEPAYEEHREDRGK